MRAHRLSCLGAWSPYFLRCLSDHTFAVSCLVASPSAGISMLLQFVFPEGFSFFGEDGGLMKESAIWSTFTFLLGVLVVFRTSQCYARWWEGSTAVFTMRAEWFDAAATLNIFISYCGLAPSKALEFKERLARLMSLLHATALAELERRHGEEGPDNLAYTYDLISSDELDEEGVRTFAASSCKVELVYGWILSLIMENVESKVLNTPAPLLTRVFQELGNGLVGFHSALRLVDVPFPLVYARTCNGLLILHMLCAPVITAQWTTHPVWAGFFTFIQVFVMNLLNRVADGLANPFGIDPNDVDGAEMQKSMNKWLMSTLDPGVSKAPLFLRAEKTHGQPKRPNSVNRMYTLNAKELSPEHSYVFDPAGSIGSGDSGSFSAIRGGGAFGLVPDGHEARAPAEGLEPRGAESQKPPRGAEGHEARNQERRSQTDRGGGERCHSGSTAPRSSGHSHLSISMARGQHGSEASGRASLSDVDMGDQAVRPVKSWHDLPEKVSESTESSWQPVLTASARSAPMESWPAPKSAPLQLSMLVPGSVAASGRGSGAQFLA